MSDNKALSSPAGLTTETLRAIVYDEIISLRSGKSSSQRAGALGKLVNNIVSLSKLDIDAARVAYGIDDKNISISAVSLSSDEGKENQR